jgi:anti-sigma regulatory factor (Ser/Thr protein kinase)
MHQGQQLASAQVREWRFDTSLPRAPRPALATTAGPPAAKTPDDGQDRITLAPVPESARAAREFTTATLRRWHLDALVSDAVLIASELVTNAINHGGQAGAQLELSWSYQASQVICVVTDHAAEPPVMATADPDAESGHGLRIVGALAASWGWTMLGAGEKAVWAALPLPAAAVADRGALASVFTPAGGPGRQAGARAADLGRPDPFPAAR